MSRTIRIIQSVGCEPYREGDSYNNFIITNVQCLGEVAEPHPHTCGELEFELTLDRPCQCGSGIVASACNERRYSCG